VRAIRDALASQGFEIFWDQAVPPGSDWDTWIRQHLNEAKCALVFWSKNSVGSDNVRHEATVAKQQGKLIPVLLDALTVEQFPMGLYSTQGADLTNWAGGEQEQSWSTLKQHVEFKLTPLWVRRLIDGMEAELIAERARREGAERRDRTLRDQIVKEAQAQQELRRERDDAQEGLAALKSQLEAVQKSKAEWDRGRQEMSRRIEQLENEQQLRPSEADEARRKIADLERIISETEAARDRAIEENSGLQRRLDAAEAEARTANAQAETLVAQLRDAQPVNALSGQGGAAPSPPAASPLQGDRPSAAFLASQSAAGTSPRVVDRRDPDAPQISPPPLPEGRQKVGRRPVIEALVFLFALPFVYMAAIALFTGLLHSAPQSAFIGAGIVIVAYAALRLRQRTALVTGFELALYWVGCAIAIAGALAAIFYASSGSIHGLATGLLLGAVLAAASAVAIKRRWRSQPMSGPEFAVYWLGCLSLAAAAFFTFVVALHLSLFAGYRSVQTGLFLAGGVALLGVLAVAYMRRARLDDAELALYWLGGSVAAAFALPGFWYGIEEYATDRHAFIGLAVAAAVSLAAAAVLIFRRRMRLTEAEMAVYFIGAPITAAYLVGGAFGETFDSAPAGLFAGAVALVIFWGGLAIYVWRYRRPDAPLHAAHTAASRPSEAS
jgi:MFS family permease